MKCTNLQVPRAVPARRSVKGRLKERRREEGKVMGSGVLEYAAKERISAFGLNFVL